MPKHNLVIKDSDNLIIRGVQVVGSIEYFPASQGSYFDPPEPSDVGRTNLTTLDGQPFELVDADYEDSKLFDALDVIWYAASCAFDRVEDDVADQVADHLEFQGVELPF